MDMSDANKNNLIGLGIKALGTIFTGVAERIRARRLAREEKETGSACPKCGTILPQDARFCFGCGMEEMGANAERLRNLSEKVADK